MGNRNALQHKVGGSVVSVTIINIANFVKILLHTKKRDLDSKRRLTIIMIVIAEMVGGKGDGSTNDVFIFSLLFAEQSEKSFMHLKNTIAPHASLQSPLGVYQKVIICSKH